MEDPKTGRKIVLKHILNVDTMTPEFMYPGWVPMQSPTNPNHIYFEKAGRHTRFTDATPPLRPSQHPLDNGCPYSICTMPHNGHARTMFASDGAGNYCLCDTPYDVIDADNYCGMSPRKYDITHEQVDRWNEVVDSIIEARDSGLTYRQWFLTDIKKQALQEITAG
jgi:hypothetical protein